MLTSAAASVLPPPMVRSSVSDVKVVVTDMDGTFLDGHHGVSESTKSAYRAATAAGKRIVPATGRSLFSLEHVLNIADPNFAAEFRKFPGIYCNGSIVYGESVEDIIYNACLPDNLLQAFFEAAYTWQDERIKQGLPAPLTLFCIRTSEISCIDFATENYKEYKELWFEEDSIALDKRLNDPSVKLEGVALLDAISTAELIPNLQNFVQNYPAYVEVVKNFGAELVAPIPPLLSCWKGGENKLKSFHILQKKYPELQGSQWMTIGDGLNDVEMLRGAPLSCAMGQASETVRDCAGVITTSNSEDGWANAINQFVLHGKKENSKLAH